MTGFSFPEACVPHTVPNRFRKTLSLGIVLLTGLIAYANSLHAPFQFDDFGISDKAQLLLRLSSSTSRQVVDYSFLLNHSIHGNNVFGYHLLNLLIHLCSAVAIYYLAAYFILALSGENTEVQSGKEAHFILLFVPLATALLFVSHPVQTQAVTYIVQRYTSLATLFYLLSTVMFVRARSFHVNGARRIQIWLAGMASVIFGLLAMRCKEISFTLPVMLLLVELFIFQGRMLRNRTFLAGMTLLLLIIPVQQILHHGSARLDDLLYGLSKGTREELTYSRTDYLLTQFRVVVTYVRLLIFPVNQNLDYDYPLQKLFFTVPVISSLLFHLLILSSAAFMFFKSRNFFKEHNVINGTCLRLGSLGVVWFYVTLSVESSIIPILDVIFEHRLYLPSGGFFLAVVSLSALYLVRREPTRVFAWATLVLLCLILTTATIRRNMIWNDELRLWEDTANKSPHKPRVLNNLATFYIVRHMPEKAIAPLLHALDREPGSTESLNNIEVLLAQIPEARGRFGSGTKFLTGNNNVDVRFIDPWFAITRNNLGLAYELQGDRTKALLYYEKAVTLAPKSDVAWLNLTLLSAQQGNNIRALEALDKLKQLNPLRAKAVEQYILKTK